MPIDPSVLKEGLIYLLMMIAAISLHEWGHAWMADRLGDPTPRSQDRVTLNPLAHIDLIGTVLIPFLSAVGIIRFGMVGWGKPVQIDPGAYRRRHFDQALVTLAGPAMNVILGIVAVLALAACHHFFPEAREVEELFGRFLALNIGLIVFNLLPIPPLDGSKFLMYWFGMGEEAYYNLARWGFLILFVLVNIPGFGRVLNALMGVVGMPFYLLYNILT